MILLFVALCPHLWVRYVEGLLRNVHGKGYNSVCFRDAVNNRGQGMHVPLFRRVCNTQEICRETQSHIQYLAKGSVICLCSLMRLCVKCTHPRCCSSAYTALECCSTLGCCSRCCLNWAHLTTTPVTMEMHAQKLLSVTLRYDTAHPAPHIPSMHPFISAKMTFQ